MPHTLEQPPPCTPSALAQRLHLLSNGRYAVLLAADGTGYSAFDGFAITRWAPDAVTPAGGLTGYLRCLDSGAFHTLGGRAGGDRTRAPSRVAGPNGSHTFRCVHGIAESAFIAAAIETHTRVGVPAGVNAEIRVVTLSNHGDRRRRLELTTFCELVLNTLAADAAHPAFSKLFVQTAFEADRDALVAWRRPRSPDDPPMWAAHRLLVSGDAGGDDGAGAQSQDEGGGAAGAEGARAESQYETDRARFIGRGRSWHAPAALATRAPLSGTVGNVLDPVFSARRTVTLDPGASTRFAMVLTAGRSRGEVLATLDELGSLDGCVAALDAAAAPSAAAAASLGIPMSWWQVVALAGAGASPAAGSVAADSGAGANLDHAASAIASAAAADLPDAVIAPADPSAVAGDAAAGGEALRMFNGTGGFAPAGDEYVIRVRTDAAPPRLPPLPWCNVIANEEFGFLVSERGAASTWAANSRENRVTPWYNDPITDPYGEALYVRDDDARTYWSPVPGPVEAGGEYEVRHGFGYTRFLHTRAGLRHDTCMFVARADPVRFVRLALTNAGDRSRRVSLFSYAQLVLGVLPQETRGSIRTRVDAGAGAVFAHNPRRGEFSDRVAFAAAIAPADAAIHAATDRAAFIGAGGSIGEPRAVRAPVPLAGRDGSDPDPCAALQCTIEVAAGTTRVVTFVLGEAASEAAAREVLSSYPDAVSVDAAFDAARGFWRDLLGRVRIETPAPALDLLVNGWLSYQNLACRMWGRTAFYQSGGAFGFRDQLQDSAALLYLSPHFTRQQLLLHAAHQFVEGDVLHWWHPPSSKGIRTRFSDDLLWLPYITSFYIRCTGDAGVLDETVGYLAAEPLAPGVDEVFVCPAPAGVAGTLYDHCCRALDRSLTAGAHGLPLMGTGDWNDGMNRVGRAGLGESVWLGFFLFDILTAFVPLCVARGDDERAARYRAHQAGLHVALNDGGWDGAWYRRAYYDSGVPLGSSTNDECRIDTIAQAWAVLSRAAPAGRAERAIDALEQHLISAEDRLIRLLMPAFDRTPHDPGYIKGYLPGVRENGGQYTHGALWAVRAVCELGRAGRAAELLEMLSPVTHTADERGVERYQAEPYVVAADVYGVAPHVGRGGWTWYTGSAGWMFRVALESVLGFELRGSRHVVLRPCIPAGWPGFTLRYTLPGADTTYTFRVVRAPAGGEGSEATLDGAALPVERGAVLVPILADGGAHLVRVSLAGDVTPRYAPLTP